MAFCTIKEAIRTGSRLKLSMAEWQLSSPRRDRTHWKVFDLVSIAHAVEFIESVY